MNASNYVIIRVWFCKADGGANVGHASLETKNEYLSLWPGKNSKAKTRSGQLFEHRTNPHFQSSYNDDIVSEGRPPEYVCYLYSLDISKIDMKIQDIKCETNQWSTAGNTWFGNWSNGISRSCSGAVWEALLAGHMNYLASPGFLTNLMTSPHNVFTWARKSKIVELKKYPQTNEFDAYHKHVYNPHDEVLTMAIFQFFQFN